MENNIFLIMILIENSHAFMYNNDNDNERKIHPRGTYESRKTKRQTLEYCQKSR